MPVPRRAGGGSAGIGTSRSTPGAMTRMARIPRGAPSGGGQGAAGGRPGAGAGKAAGGGLGEPARIATGTGGGGAPGLAGRLGAPGSPGLSGSGETPGAGSGSGRGGKGSLRMAAAGTPGAAGGAGGRPGSGRGPGGSGGSDTGSPVRIAMAPGGGAGAPGPGGMPGGGQGIGTGRARERAGVRGRRKRHRPCHAGGARWRRRRWGRGDEGDGSGCRAPVPVGPVSSPRWVAGPAARVAIPAVWRRSRSGELSGERRWSRWRRPGLLRRRRGSWCPWPDPSGPPRRRAGGLRGA